MQVFHTPVLLQEVIEGLAIKLGNKYIDATLGGGGHALEIVKRGGEVLGIDVDQEAIDYVKKKIRNSKFEIRNLTLVHGNFKDLGEIARKNGFEKVAGILFDLGVSLHQLTSKERGFSFAQDAPLDMRMDPSTSSGPSVKASDLVNGLYKNELAYIFQKYGEERLARRIADAICRAREVRRIETTSDLVRIIEKVKPRHGRMHPATQVFQALRIAVNDELGNLEKALPQAAELLRKEGRIAVISFHSLEDRIVKNFFKRISGMYEIAKKPIVPSEEEVERNPRARSAKLRIYAKN